MLIRELFEQIKNTPGSNDKKQLLDGNINSTIKQIFEDTYGPQKYFVKKYNVKSSGNLTIDDSYHIFNNMLKYLSSRIITGNAAIELVENTIGLYILEDQWVLKAVMDRNLKIGLSINNFSKVSGDDKNDSSKFEVALAHNLDKTKGVNPIDGTYYASRKLDGCRTICIVNNEVIDGEFKQDVKFYSRNGKEFNTLSNLIEPVKHFTSQLTGKWVLDGETCIMEDDKENFNLLMREVTRKNHTIENPRYCIFDILSIDEFEGKTESQNFENRYNNLLEHYYSSQYEPMVQSRIKILEQELITSQDLFDKWTKSVSDNNWEGFMLRKNAPFKSGRSKDLLKVKKFQDAEYIIEDILTGKVFYNENGMKEHNVVTAVIINHKGTKVQVGSGLSKEQRINWFNNPQEIIGKTATIQYFEETVNKNDDSLSLRFPVLKHVYEDGRKV